MPPTHVVSVTTDSRVYTVTKNGVEKQVNIIQRRNGEVYVHYIDTDRRMDEWVPDSMCHLQPGTGPAPAPSPKPPAEGSGSSNSRKRQREGSSLRNKGAASHLHAPSFSGANGGGGHYEEDGGEDVDMGVAPTTTTTEVVMTEEEYDLRHHQQLHTQKNFDTVIFDTWKIKPWYFSPYPLTETEAEDMASASSTPAVKIPGVARATPRSHGRTSDLLVGGLLRQHTGESMLWVCHFCFKYMADGGPWELHKKECKMKHPPGRKVYQRGAHIIWEVDAAKEKLYCQNLSLFGKLFIDVKTLFFDCDNFLFYILTDAKSSEDHILGFFSKEKLSYDDYNLACIMTLPQYQKKGYGMLMIEFSYELSRRAGKVGSPERPLSDLGLRSYLAYWISTILRFLRRVLTVLPPDVLSARNENSFPELTDGGVQVLSGEVERMQAKKRKIQKGFDGEGGAEKGSEKEKSRSVEQGLGVMPFKSIHEPKFTTQRIFETIPRADGGAETHVKVHCTLADIARATNLRADDAAFALNECGLLMHRMRRDEGSGSGSGTPASGSGTPGVGAGAVSHQAGEPSEVPVPSQLQGQGQGQGQTQAEAQIQLGENETIVITREMVERVAKERNVKIMYMDLSCVLI